MRDIGGSARPAGGAFVSVLATERPFYQVRVRFPAQDRAGRRASYPAQAYGVCTAVSQGLRRATTATGGRSHGPRARRPVDDMWLGGQPQTFGCGSPEA